MMRVTIYHNPRCSTSRRTLQLLRDTGVEPEIVEYLRQPPDAALLKNLLNMLGVSPRDLLRRGEAAYKQLGLADPGKSDDELIAAIVENPILLERPIVVKGAKAALGRPPENVLEIL
jgi:arsenate reductase